MGSLPNLYRNQTLRGNRILTVATLVRLTTIYTSMSLGPESICYPNRFLVLTPPKSNIKKTPSDLGYPPSPSQ